VTLVLDDEPPQKTEQFTYSGEGANGSQDVAKDHQSCEKDLYQQEARTADWSPCSDPSFYCSRQRVDRRNALT
jgi:hypothetical protein